MGGFSPTGSPFVDVVPLKTITANHQDLPYYPELYAVFAAVGAGVGRGVLGLVQSTSVAPTIAALLGIQPPLNSTGTPLPITSPIFTVSVETKTETVTSYVTSTVTAWQTLTQTSTRTETSVSLVTVTERYTDPVYVGSLVAIVVIGYVAVLLARRKIK
ncbi:hypothetical protein WLZ34_06445 [Thermogladius sp. KZ2Tp1]|uniref:hypothetical protein n=1 Tax=Thermogladius sp. KZ2Tp1 TaxID=3136289 RepID=UPI003DAA2021